MTKKGRRGEYEVMYALKGTRQYIEPVFLTKPTATYDIVTDKEYFEVKKHKSFTWNKLLKIWADLIEHTPSTHRPYLVFIANRQPACVMFSICGVMTVQTFEDFFGLKWTRYEDIPKDKHIQRTYKEKGFSWGD